MQTIESIIKIAIDGDTSSPNTRWTVVIDGQEVANGHFADEGCQTVIDSNEFHFNDEFLFHLVGTALGE